MQAQSATHQTALSKQGPLKLIQIFTFYEHYQYDFYQKRPNLSNAPFQAQMEEYLRDGFTGLHIFAPELKKLGYDSRFVIANAEIAQKAWAREHKVTFSDANWRNEILSRQIEEFKPDIIYCLNPVDFDARFFSKLSWKPSLLLGWRAAYIPPGTDWSNFDLILSHLSVCRERALQLGSKNSEFFHPAVPAFIPEAVKTHPKQYDVVFSGQWTPQHKKRNEIITFLASKAAQEGFSLGLFLATHNNDLPKEVLQYNQGPRWGMEMYLALRSGKIVINAEIDLAMGEAGNMRLFETTACGSFLLTEHHKNVAEYFEPGKDIETFSSPEELLSKIKHYLAHPGDRELIAVAGQAKCLTNHSMAKKSVDLHTIIERHLRLKQKGSGTASINAGVDTQQSNNTIVRFSSLEPEEALRMGQQAIALMQSGKLLEALELLDRVAQSGIPILGLQYLRTLCLGAVGKHVEALDAATKEVFANPTNHQARAEFERLSELLKLKRAPQPHPEQRPYTTDIEPKTLLNIQSAKAKYSYRGSTLPKNPFDLALYQTLLWNTKPKSIIEIGSKTATSALWLADLVDTFGLAAHIYSTDSGRIKDSKHSKVTFLGGTLPELAKTISSDFIAKLSRPLLVIQTAGADTATTNFTLNFFHQHLRPEEYIVIESEATNFAKEQTLVDGSQKALKEFIENHPGEYEVDSEYADFYGYNCTSCVNGFLKKKTYPLNPTISKPILREFLGDDPATRGVESQMCINERFQVYALMRSAFSQSVEPVRFIEIGSHAGASLYLTYLALKRLGRGVEGYAIEPQGQPQFYEILKIISSEVKHFRMFSHEGSLQLKAHFEPRAILADFILVDGDHSYEGVRQDILDYYSLLKTGGIMLFHDFLPELNNENKAAIFFHHAGKEPGIRRACVELMEDKFKAEVLDLPLLYPTDPTQTQSHLPVIPGVYSTIRAYRKRG